MWIEMCVLCTGAPISNTTWYHESMNKWFLCCQFEWCSIIIIIIIIWIDAGAMSSLVPCLKLNSVVTHSGSSWTLFAAFIVNTVGIFVESDTNTVPQWPIRIQITFDSSKALLFDDASSALQLVYRCMNIIYHRKSYSSFKQIYSILNHIIQIYIQRMRRWCIESHQFCWIENEYAFVNLLMTLINAQFNIVMKKPKLFSYCLRSHIYEYTIYLCVFVLSSCDRFNKSFLILRKKAINSIAWRRESASKAAAATSFSCRA